MPLSARATSATRCSRIWTRRSAGCRGRFEAFVHNRSEGRSHFSLDRQGRWCAGVLVWLPPTPIIDGAVQRSRSNGIRRSAFWQPNLRSRVPLWVESSPSLAPRAVIGAHYGSLDLSTPKSSSPNSARADIQILVLNQNERVTGICLLNSELGPTLLWITGPQRSRSYTEDLVLRVQVLDLWRGWQDSNPRPLGS